MQKVKKLSSARLYFTQLIVLKRRDSNFLGTLSGALAAGDFSYSPMQL